MRDGVPRLPVSVIKRELLTRSVRGKLDAARALLALMDKHWGAEFARTARFALAMLDSTLADAAATGGDILTALVAADRELQRVMFLVRERCKMQSSAALTQTWIEFFHCTWRGQLCDELRGVAVAIGGEPTYCGDPAWSEEALEKLMASTRVDSRQGAAA